MRVSPFWMPLLVIVTLLGSIGIAQIAGVWTTSGRTAVDYENMVPDDIKGWMTLQQVMDGLKISQSELYALGNIPADVAPETALKDLEGIAPDFEISTLRDKLNARANGTPSGTESAPAATSTSQPIPQNTALPQPTALPQATALPQGTVHVTPTPLPAGAVLPADQIKGRMTLQEVSDQCAVPLDKLLAALNLPADTNANTALKDLVSAGKISEIAAVQSAAAELQK